MSPFLWRNSYILYVPFETEDASESGIVYVWIGSKSTAEESKLIQEIAEEMFNNPWVSLQVGFSYKTTMTNRRSDETFLFFCPDTK